MGTVLAEVLNHNLAKRGWTFERLAVEAGLPRNTVYRWTRGEVKKVRHWQDLVKAARALDLNQSQTSALLEAGGHPSVAVLRERAKDEADRELLSRWTCSTPNNLPAQLTSFVGRQEELEHLTRLLSSVRLITLTGAGGAGKTRLALEVAQAALDEFEGVYFVDLASTRDPNLVISTISQTLDLRESPDESPLRALKRHLRDRKILLVLDNLEQVLGTAPLLAELLVATRRVKALVTSRARLNVRGEHEFPVLPLPLPDPAFRFEELTHNPSVTLFVDRTRVANPSFALSPHNAQLVVEVCERLDGLPLGIELAAAKTRQVRLCSMLERFPGRLALANGGPRDVPDRQQTLRATIAWSYNLLGADQQMLFKCLGVFAGGFAEGVAGSICGRIGQTESEVSEGLESLAEQNLIKRILNEADEPRYEMLETIREYALEKLNECGESEGTLRTASEYYLGLAEGADLRQRTGVLAT